MSLFPIWPEGALAGKRELGKVIEAFVETVTLVPLKASSETGQDGWRAWYDGGFAAHKFIASKLSRDTFTLELSLLLRLVLRSQERYPDLYAVLKFVPKKNGLNPSLEKLLAGDEAAVAIDSLTPREVRRNLDDLQRAIEQAWLLFGCYLTLPDKKCRADFLWSVRTVIEKVKTDQRSRATELLCLAFFGRSSPLFGVVALPKPFTFQEGFEKNYGIDVWHPKPTNARMIWQRSRMVYPFLEAAHRTWLHELDGKPDPAGLSIAEVAQRRAAVCPNHAAAVGQLLDRIARASPQEKVLNSLLYWLIDLTYKEMLSGEEIKPWAPEPFILRRKGAEERMMRELAKLGHLVQILCRSECLSSALLLQVKEITTTTTLLASIKATCAESCPLVLADYEVLMKSPELTIGGLEDLEFEALGALLDVDGDVVRSNAPTVRRALAEWRNPELLFRYLDDNREDPEMVALITRWLRAIFGLSGETLRMIRRESPENVRHLLMIPQDVLLRWYSEDCPGTSKCKTLFMVGEDAGSCLRIISNQGNKYNRALMGYVLQSHVRALVVFDAVGRVMVRALIRLVLRSDSLTPVIFCDPMFFTVGYSRELQREVLAQARRLEEHMQIPVVHAGSILPVLEDCDVVAVEKDGQECFVNPDALESWPEGDFGACAGQGYVRRVQVLDYDITWVELIEMDGVAPYTYSEELPYDDLLQQHEAGVLTRNKEYPALVVAALPRADSPSADRYVREREGETAWTMHLTDGGGADKVDLPQQLAAQIAQRENVALQAVSQPLAVSRASPAQLDPNARAWDQDLPSNFKAPDLDGMDPDDDDAADSRPPTKYKQPKLDE